MAAFRVVKTAQQPDEGRFPRAVFTHEQ
jgi:hypothetical protein